MGRGIRSAGGSSSSSNYQGYRNDHCFFYLAPSGELIFRDLSPCLAEIIVIDPEPGPDEGRLYRMHGSRPRQRVIPRTDMKVLVVIGSNTTFRFVWWDNLTDQRPKTQAFLAARARSHAAAGVNFTVPGSSRDYATAVDRSDMQVPELRSRYAPSVAPKTGPRKDCHKYDCLGSGGFGVVYKTVDLATGELWAVKEFANPAEGKDGGKRPGTDGRLLKASLVREVEHMATISHAHIVHYETYQGFHEGGPFQIFYKLYEGSLADLITPWHRCVAPPPRAATWMPRLVTHMAGAMAYLHAQGILHLDIKPANILFDTTPGDPEPRFYLGDFGLATAEANATGTTGRGSPLYMAPEVAFGFANAGPAADVWSFAMTIGEALGIWCSAELDPNAKGGGTWLRKLPFLRAGTRAYTEEPGWAATHRDVALYRRISTIVALGVLPPMFAKMLVGHESRPTARSLTTVNPEEFTRRPWIPMPLVNWEGANVSWMPSDEGSAGRPSQLPIAKKTLQPPQAISVNITQDWATGTAPPVGKPPPVKTTSRPRLSTPEPFTQEQRRALEREEQSQRHKELHQQRQLLQKQQLDQQQLLHLQKKSRQQARPQHLQQQRQQEPSNSPQQQAQQHVRAQGGIAQQQQQQQQQLGIPQRKEGQQRQGQQQQSPARQQQQNQESPMGKGVKQQRQRLPLPQQQKGVTLPSISVERGSW